MEGANTREVFSRVRVTSKQKLKDIRTKISADVEVRENGGGMRSLKLRTIAVGSN